MQTKTANCQKGNEKVKGSKKPEKSASSDERMKKNTNNYVFKRIEENNKTQENQNAQKTGIAHTNYSMLSLEDESKIKSRSDTSPPKNKVLPKTITKQD